MKLQKYLPLLAATMLAAPAMAAPVIVTTNANLVSSPFSFNVQGATFTLSATNNIFAPLNVQTSANGAFSSFGGFLSIPVTPSPSFTNRGTVQYGPGVFGSYASFTSPTNVASSNGNNFLGFRALVGSDAYYGFVFTTNGILNGYGYETSANTVITATTAAVPEPATWAMMIGGFAFAGAVMRRRRSATKPVYA